MPAILPPDLTLATYHNRWYQMLPGPCAFTLLSHPGTILRATDFVGICWHWLVVLPEIISRFYQHYSGINQRLKSDVAVAEGLESHRQGHAKCQKFIWSGAMHFRWKTCTALQIRWHSICFNIIKAPTKTLHLILGTHFYTGKPGEIFTKELEINYLYRYGHGP